MTFPPNITVLAAALVLFLCAGRGMAAEPELKSWLGSAFTVPGEETELWLWVLSETRPAGTPKVPSTSSVTIRLLDDHTLPQRTRQKIYLYQYSIRSYAEGTHTIPSIEVTLNGESLRSQPIDLHVSPLPANSWNTHRLLGREFRFASTIFVPGTIPYEGQTIPAEVKVYLPEKHPISDASIAEIDHDGVVAWRFEASAVPIDSPFAPRIFRSRVRMDGQEFIGVSYRSTVTAIRTGPVSLGPGEARLTLSAQVSNRGINIRQNIATQLKVPPREFRARSLPPNPPSGFKNAVGRFNLSALANTSDLQEGDPITVRLSISGVGNLDTVYPPFLDADENEWKVYQPSRLPRQGEKRDTSGVVTFSQILRPLGSQRVIPPFRLVFFNPKEERYQTISSPPIPFEVTTASGRPSSAPLTVLPDLDTPVEQMEGVLGLIEPSRALRSSPAVPWWRSWHLLPALAALLLLARLAQLHLLPRFRRSTREHEVERALASLGQAGPGAREFLRASGTFIETWIPGPNRDQEVEALLERRDLDCYRPDAGQQQLAADQRSKIIDHLRSRALAAVPALAILLTLALAIQAPAASPVAAEALYQQAEAAWTEGSYRAAIDLYQSAHPDGNLPADVWYNLGNCHFQLGEPGLAALHYHRALHLEPRHPEARQNLRFLKRKTGAITVLRPNHQEQLGRYDRSLFLNLSLAGLWATGLAVLGIFAAPTKALRALVWTGLAAGPLCALAGAVCLRYYPNDAEFAPPTERGIVVSSEVVPARTEASTASAVVIPVPPGSVCRLLARRGPWTYVELANQTRGWLPSTQVQLIVPDRDPARTEAIDLGA